MFDVDFNIKVEHRNRCIWMSISGMGYEVENELRALHTLLGAISAEHMCYLVTYDPLMIDQLGISALDQAPMAADDDRATGYRLGEFDVMNIDERIAEVSDSAFYFCRADFDWTDFCAQYPGAYRSALDNKMMAIDGVDCCFLCGESGDYLFIKPQYVDEVERFLMVMRDEGFRIRF